jgi:hypothetical protein
MEEIASSWEFLDDLYGVLHINFRSVATVVFQAFLNFLPDHRWLWGKIQKLLPFK